MIKSLTLAVLLLAASLSASVANTITFVGNTTGMPTFNRPTETGARSSVGTAVPFVAYQIDVVTGGLFNFTLDAVNPATYDTFLHLYNGSFNAADTSDPAFNFLAGNDDRSLTSSNSSLVFTLASGGRYFFVVDGFLNSDFGAYTTSISSTSGFFNARAVPDAGSTLVLAGISLALLALARRQLGWQTA